MYAHEYKCHVLNNTEHSEGCGHMIGEANETDWSLITHLVTLTRVVFRPRRLQRIDNHPLYT